MTLTVVKTTRVTWLYHQRNQFRHEWWCDSDLAFCWSPTEGRCGHELSMPDCVKGKSHKKRSRIKQDLPVHINPLKPKFFFWCRCKLFFSQYT